MNSADALRTRMRGAYCLVALLPKQTRIRVGAIGRHDFRPGAYVYIGSALGGIEKRVGRHKSNKKRKKWHIDYLLAKAEVLSTISIPCDGRDVECEVARALVDCEGASIPVKRFGSSDCKCASHLLYFGNVDAEWVLEELSMRLSMLKCVYPMRL